LRYWVTEMRVDGFRFDLAVTLGRGGLLRGFDGWSAFFAAVHQDPVLRTVKLIAEPWDIGEGGYQVGNFPIDWAEWNGRYRDTVRAFWRAQPDSRADFATRFTGSADLFADGRLPGASVNIVTTHDGFTLHDLVSYNEKHNDANGEDNRDGEGHNRSWNLGAEGPTDDEAILARRRKQKRTLLTTLVLSQGTPLIVHGDELGRTQRGNNNAYCQDNELTWIDWEGADRELIAFVARLIALRRSHPVLRRMRWLHDRRGRMRNRPPAHWYRPDGAPMDSHHWSDGTLAVALVLDRAVSPGVSRSGIDEVDDSFCFLFNAHLEPRSFTLPPPPGGTSPWSVVVDTAVDRAEPDPLKTLSPGDSIELTELSMIVALARQRH